MNRLNKTESAVLLYCRFSLFLKDSFFQIIYIYRALQFSRTTSLMSIYWYKNNYFAFHGAAYDMLHQRKAKQFYSNLAFRLRWIKNIGLIAVSLQSNNGIILAQKIHEG